MSELHGVGVGSFEVVLVNLGVSENYGIPRVFHYKPSILGYPYFWKHPFKGKGLVVFDESWMESKQRVTGDF